MLRRTLKLVVVFFIIILLVMSYSREEVVKEWNTPQGLPIIIINTKGSSINGDEKIIATMEIYQRQENIRNEVASDFASQIGIKQRGRSSRKFPKKQFSIELQDSNGYKKKENLLGMSKDSDWVLNAPFEDKSLIRNYMAYTVAGEIMTYAPEVRFCEVYIIDDGSDKIQDKHFVGLYLLVEKIKRGEERVDITPSQENEGETSFIVAKDAAKIHDIIIPTYGREVYLYESDIVSIYPKRNLSKTQMDYISKTISEFERVLYSDKYDVKGEGYRQYIDVESFVDYYLINEFFNNTDAGIFSTYIYKDYGEKISAGPVWDFNIAMGNSNLASDYYDYTGFYMLNTSWFERLMKDRKFVDQVVERYKLLRQTYFSNEYIMNFIDEAIELLGEAPRRNFSVWSIDLCNQAQMFINSSPETFQPYENDIESLVDYLDNNPHLLYPTDGLARSYEEEISLLKEFIVNRGKWMDENIDSLYKWTD